MDKQVNESGLEPKEEIQELVRTSREAQKQIENYTDWTIAGLVAATLGAPADVVKTRIMNQPLDPYV